MPQEIETGLKQRLIGDFFRPAITTWNRLDTRVRKEDFDRSLLAEVRDPLWMLCRQWQFGEFKGEDAGSAVQAKVQLDTSRINRFAVKTEDRTAGGAVSWHPTTPYSDALPLETKVEREALSFAGQDSKTGHLELRIQSGRHWVRLLKQRGLEGFATLFIGRFPFADLANLDELLPAEALEKAHVQSELSAWQTLQALQGRLPDGLQILQEIKKENFDAWVETAPEITSVTEKSNIKQLGQEYAAWFFRVYSQPETGVENAWAPSYLEYQFAVSAPNDENGRSSTTLLAEQYHHGRLDWYSFDVAPKEQLSDDPDATYEASRFKKEEPLAFFPTQIEFNGMPNVRWWAFEDQRTDFGQLRASTTDIAQLVLAEFGLIYGNDWSVVPYNVEAGSICAIKGIIVTDVFGLRTFIRPAINTNDEKQYWNLYKLSIAGTDGQVDHRLFLPPAIGNLQEGKPIEKILLARDEMANMVWGIENTIPGILGTGINGFEAATALSNYFLQQNDQEEDTPLIPNDAKIQFRLGTSVPENWIPFIARHKPGSNREIRLQRAAMPRLTDQDGLSITEPRGQILRTGLDQEQTYFIHEEEVLRAGSIVTRSFQRTRWLDGKVYTWVGRRKQTGRGEGASGLEFDQVVSINANV